MICILKSFDLFNIVENESPFAITPKGLFYVKIYNSLLFQDILVSQISGDFVAIHI